MDILVIVFGTFRQRGSRKYSQHGGSFPAGSIDQIARGVKP